MDPAHGEFHAIVTRLQFGGDYLVAASSALFLSYHHCHLRPVAFDYWASAVDRQPPNGGPVFLCQEDWFFKKTNKHLGWSFQGSTLLVGWFYYIEKYIFKKHLILEWHSRKAKAILRASRLLLNLKKDDSNNLLRWERTGPRSTDHFIEVRNIREKDGQAFTSWGQNRQGKVGR